MHDIKTCCCSAFIAFRIRNFHFHYVSTCFCGRKFTVHNGNFRLVFAFYKVNFYFCRVFTGEVLNCNCRQGVFNINFAIYCFFNCYLRNFFNAHICNVEATRRLPISSLHVDSCIARQFAIRPGIRECVNIKSIFYPFIVFLYHYLVLGTAFG